MGTQTERGLAMAALLTQRFTTHADYLAWLDMRPDEEWYEVVDGMPLMNPAPRPRHQRCLRAVFRLLDSAVPEGFEALFAPFDWVLAQGSQLEVRQPDAVVTRIFDDDARALFEPPLLAVEVVSPTSVERDLVAKRRAYATAGLDHYWVVDPETPQVGIYRSDGADLVLVQHAVGAARLVIDVPLRVTFAPDELLR